MDRNDSHGRHGGNRGSVEARDDGNPNKRPDNSAVDSLKENRNPSKGGGKSFGGR